MQIFGTYVHQNKITMGAIQKITPNLWFDHQAEDAAKYYVGIFRDSSISKVTHYGKAGHEIHKMEEGTVMTVEFTLAGQKFVALNGGPIFKFNEAVSFVVNCKNQQEIDYYWDALSRGGDPKAQQCGWLKDKFGVSWQVVPEQMSKLMENTETAEQVMTEMLKMKKLDLAALENAAHAHVS
jgi:predicted 3-demethylubiquinone-9 3-methyltransferase (glyoxalase superfamily)